jgi:hypothetical protein
MSKEWRDRSSRSSWLETSAVEVTGSEVTGSEVTGSEVIVVGVITPPQSATRRSCHWLVG